MSKWRQKGFVQDSDEEEEESQLESQNSRRNAILQGRVERVDHGTNYEKRQDAALDEFEYDCLEREKKSEEPRSPTTDRNSPRQPESSPFTPIAAYGFRKNSTESPDPLQPSPIPSSQRFQQSKSSQLLGLPYSTTDTSSPALQQHVYITADPHAEGGASHQPHSDTQSSTELDAGSKILGAFGIQPLSDVSDDDDLSDPPTDLESPDTGCITHQPHRRTAVQVVIPSSTALQRQVMEYESRRAFRQRKPIQLHPYALEGEMYRREVQSRGLKPVPRARSPERRTDHNDAETQEKEFDPNEAPISSPPEPEIPVSTPAARRPRKDELSPTKLRLPATQRCVAHFAKKRKFNPPLTQGATASTSIFDDDVPRRDIWSIPPNSPPHSSSPLLNGHHPATRMEHLPAITPITQLPTPSTSSILQDDPELLVNSDLDPVLRSARRPDSELRRPTRIILSDDSSSASESHSEAEQSEHELKHVVKKIKGVLPASWLRIDRQAQERRKKALERERQRAQSNAALSPEPEPQRGVAQKVVKRIGGKGDEPSSTMLAKEILILSDGSDDGRDNSAHHQIWNFQDSVEDAAALAASFDNRYADDDSDNMENDRLHLFSLGGTGSKRKKQTKLTDAFGKTKRMKTSDSTARKLGHGSLGRKKPSRPKKAHRPSLPALSVVDLDLSPSKQSGSIPQFLRIARRQALRRSDLARQSPRTKQIRLHNARDTKDANETLALWNQGALKPNVNLASQHRNVRRSALQNKVDNQQHVHQLAQVGESSNKESETTSEARTRISWNREPIQDSPVLKMFERTSTQRSKGSKKKLKPKQIFERSSRRASLPFRTAQLEGDENDFGRGHRKIAFEKGLRRAEHHVLAPRHNTQLYMNHQLARFLEEDDPVSLNTSPTTRDPLIDTATAAPPPRRRLFQKKTQAQRLDIDTREYRQPSEPAVQEILSHNTATRIEKTPPDEGRAILQGFGPYGTHYPTTFDVNSLQSDTYFHESTLIGSEDFRRALSVGQIDGRDLDEPAGYCSVMNHETMMRCGPWNDETSSALYDVARKITSASEDQATRLGEAQDTVNYSASNSLVNFLRSLANYISAHLSFSDPFDRKSFVAKMHQLLRLLFDYAHAAPDFECSNIRLMNYLLVLVVQTYQIAQNDLIDCHMQTDLATLTCNIAQYIISHVIRKGIPVISDFLEQNNRHAVRQNGIQHTEVIVESVVVCMHTLERISSPQSGFWDFVSHELSLTITNTSQIHAFESAWATIFTLVPFIEVDLSGIPVRDRKELFVGDNWTCISTILKRIFELYPNTFKKNSSSLNSYVRANLARCHRLIKRWHWQRPEQMLNAVFDFFGKNGLKQLQQEPTSSSVSFFAATSDDELLVLGPNECSFHIALKCLILGLRGMNKTYTAKKIRSFVFRTIPNHGRSYPKEQPIDEESLAALRNHHDLLCTLYWAAPPLCRPKLDLIQNLVSHEKSHREACRVNVRAWANLTTFQLSTDEPYASAKPFALWHKNIMHQTLKQYRLASTEADDFLKTRLSDGTTDVSVAMVQNTMKRNQEQVIATLRDCIAGMRKAMQTATDQFPLDNFLMDSDIVQLLELQHFEDHRLVNVIRDTLSLIREYAKLRKAPPALNESQDKSEESQDYGDFPDLDDLEEVESQPAKAIQQHNSLDFIQAPLWHLLSNAFGAETSPDDNLLMECVDTWALVADAQVVSGARSWSFYIDAFSQVSWQQLRHTEQTRKFSPYFLASLIESNTAAYEQHRHDFITVLLLCLVDRESLLRFQHRLLHAVVRVDTNHPLLKNLPFFRNQGNNDWDITADTLRSRRLTLISSLLSNMRDDLHTTPSGSSISEKRRTYATMLKDLMSRMKGNYQQLQQSTTLTGSYVEFVQKIVQFLKQYTGDICPVLPFFTDSVAFPLPSADPTYVVGRLCGYAPKAADPGTAKQLSVFIQTVSQQAAADSEQLYLINQLTTALCSDEAPAADRVALRSVLLQGIFPVYLEAAFSSKTAFVLARPALQSLRPILDNMTYDLRVSLPDSVSSVIDSIVAVSHAMIRGTEQLKYDFTLFEKPYVLEALIHMLKAMSACVSLLDYICGRTVSVGACNKPSIIAYMEEFSVYIAENIHNVALRSIPTYEGDPCATPKDGRHVDLLAFCRRGLRDSVKANWSEMGGTIWFGQGHARREVTLDIGSVDEEKSRLSTVIEMFHGTLRSVYGAENEGDAAGAALGCDVIC